jgi:hypothetical protein
MGGFEIGGSTWLLACAGGLRAYAGIFLKKFWRFGIVVLARQCDTARASVCVTPVACTDTCVHKPRKVGHYAFTH